jgi:hypothetical protein
MFIGDFLLGRGRAPTRSMGQNGARSLTPVQLDVQQHGTDGVLGSLSKEGVCFSGKASPPIIPASKTLLVFQRLGVLVIVHSASKSRLICTVRAQSGLDRWMENSKVQ